MHHFAPDYVVSGQLVHWDTIYRDLFSKIHAGRYTAQNLQDVDYWWLLREGAVELGAKPGLPINPAFKSRLQAARPPQAPSDAASVYDLVMKRLKQMSQKQPAYDPFRGPLHDRLGNLRIAAGKRLTQPELMSMEWAAPGVVGPWANEPK